MNAQEEIKKAKESRSTTLHLNDCGLKSFPEEVLEMDWLEHLDLSNYVYENGDERANNIVELPAGIGKLKNLTTLRFSANSFRDIRSLIHLPKLRELDLSYAGLTNIDRLEKLVNLVSLDLSANLIIGITPLASLVNLESLNLARNEVRSGRALAQLTKLTFLDLSYAPIEDFSFLEGLIHLQKLSLAKTLFADMEILRNLTDLKELNLNTTRFKSFEVLPSFKRLEVLNLERNKIEAIEPIRDLVFLRQLNLSGNIIKDISPLAALSNLTTLELLFNKIEDISVLKGLTNLEDLTLYANEINELEPLSGLLNLRRLHMGGNAIYDIEPLGSLTNLNKLILQNNHINRLDALSTLKQLTQLVLSSNVIRDIKPLEELKNLQHLSLNSNFIEDVHPLRQLTKLTNLNLINNRITDIRPLTPLIKSGVRVTGSDINSDGIKVSGNPLQYPPPELLQQGNEAILRYFDSLEEQGTARLFEAKLLLIGEGGAGKTSLATKLKDKDGKLPEEKDSTKGVAIQQLHFKGNNDQDFCINVWDFGGQEIYHATHQFFLTNRSLYVLVDDTRKDDKSVNDASFNFWLQVCELFGGGSPLLIVQNEKGDRSKDLDMRAMQARFDFIKDRLATNLLTGRGLDKVKTIIEHHIQQLPHVGDVVPKQWALIRQELETLSRTRDFISFDEFLALCAKHELNDEAQALSLSTLLHDLGIFLHFKDNDVLINYVILNNQWATAAVYMILDNETIKKKHGRFTRADLPLAWSDPKYKRHYAVLLELMMKFELCYELKDTREVTWLAPQLLPAQSPADIQWDYSGNLVMKYVYDFMPKGLLSRFIVRMHRYVTDISWKSGVILERKQAKALVTETYGTREIMVRVKGNDPRELMTIIAEEFQLMHNLFPNLKVKQFVPCICSDCQQQETPFFYNYEDLLRRKEKGKLTVECGNSYKDVPVTALLEGIFTTLKRNSEGQLTMDALKVFISYSEDDEKHKNNLLSHLSVLNRTGQIITWDDKDLVPGENWDERIKNEIASADIILLLITANSINKDYIWNNEINTAYDRAKNREAVAIVPIIADYCRWQILPFAENTVLPTKGEPITGEWRNENEAWTDVIMGIEKVIANIKSL